MRDINIFLYGAIAVQYLVVCLFFFRFANKAADNFFRYFAFAFLLLAIERLVWVAIEGAGELRPVVYIFRLIAFSLIIAAVLKKNRESSSGEPQ